MINFDSSNPFIVSGYSGPQYFCNRNTETTRIISNAANGINTTLLSVRRMGKSGLLYHTIHSMHQSKKGIGIYVDIFDTESLRDFTNRLASAMLKSVPQKHRLWKTIMDFLKLLRPVISYDELSGMPEVTLDYTQPKQYEHSLQSIFNFLEKQNRLIVVAIDEFQQITKYPEKNVEAMLRTYIQNLKNVRFIFSGSSQHLLTQMFHHANRPFFASTQNLFLDKIDYNDYAAFIELMFRNNKRKISKDAIAFILDFSLQHTFYTQALCNRIFLSGNKNIGIQDAQFASHELLIEFEPIFYQYRAMLTPNQWNMLKALSIEGKMYQPNARNIIHTYKLGTSSTIQRNLEALLSKEMIFKMHDEKGSYYRVYDCFLMRWLEKTR